MNTSGKLNSLTSLSVCFASDIIWDTTFEIALHHERQLKLFLIYLLTLTTITSLLINIVELPIQLIIL